MKYSITVIASIVKQSTLQLMGCRFATLLVMTIALLTLTLLCFPASAQTNKADPLEITAAESLDWDRESKTFTAIKEALAIQGDSSIAAHKLTAFYRDTSDKNFDIWQIEAKGSVIITSTNSKAYGDYALYNLDKSIATLTGKNLRLISPDQIITARDKFEYHIDSGMLKAYGRAKAHRFEDTLEADLIIAHMIKSAQGKRALNKLEAKGNVIITTPTETAHGRYGIYNAATNKVTLSGGVTLKRGPNILQGQSAEIDLSTNTSRMIGGTTATGGRVRGVFYPDSQNSETGAQGAQ